MEERVEKGKDEKKNEKMRQYGESLKRDNERLIKNEQIKKYIYWIEIRRTREYWWRYKYKYVYNEMKKKREKENFNYEFIRKYVERMKASEETKRNVDDKWLRYT